MAAMTCLILACQGQVRAGNLDVPNYSFEIPNIGTNSPYAAPVLASWEETPQPSWYDPAYFGGSPWYYLVGTFYNLPDYTNSSGTNTSFIYNCDGTQAAFLFAVPQVGILQQLNATYKTGDSYTMTAGVIGGGGGMPEGSTLDLMFYYLDAQGNTNFIADTTVTNTAQAFPNDTNFLDFQVQLPAVQATDPWAGKNIGIQFLATPNFFDSSSWGGYWDIDNVRLVETPPLSLGSPGFTNGQFGFTVQSAPNKVVQVLSSTDLTVPIGSWTNVGTITNVTGTAQFVAVPDAARNRFYTAKLVSP
jgi:hypothetical protein